MWMVQQFLSQQQQQPAASGSGYLDIGKQQRRRPKKYNAGIFQSCKACRF
jgi:hypothetical protein